MKHMNYLWLAAFLFLGHSNVYSKDSKLCFFDDLSMASSKDGLTLRLKFSEALKHKDLKPEYTKTFIQFVLPGVGVKKALVRKVNDPLLEKIFIYQYEPGVARVRLFLKEDGEKVKGKLNLWNLNQKTIALLLKSKEEKVVEPAAAVSAVSKTDVDLNEVEEKKILTNLMTKEEAAPIAAKQPDIGIKTEPSHHFLRMVISLLAIISLFLGVVYALKHYSTKIDLKKLPFGKKERLIQVVASHRLGKNQALSLIKITGEYMVVGVSGENISLITKLGKDIEVEKYLENRYWGGVFENHLKAFEATTPAPMPVVAAATAQVDPIHEVFTESNKVKELNSVRNNIKEKLNHLKSLA